MMYKNSNVTTSTLTLLRSIGQILLRYFVGTFVDMLCVMALLALGLGLIADYTWQQALLIGLVAGVLNIIPYIGALIGYILGFFMCLFVVSITGVAFVPLLLKTLAVFLGVQLLDMFVLQPFIYSSSVKAHPLEIFCAVLVAGCLFGIVGMLIVIPLYAITKLLAKAVLLKINHKQHFFEENNHYKQNTYDS
ncbi:MAG: AI-2E family transporter [Bacteroidales bacterium]